MAGRWKWLLLTFCGIYAVGTIAYAADNFGFNGHALYGWWDVIFFANGQPYTVTFDPPAPGGAADLGGIRAGDRLDLREQTLNTRLKLAFQPAAAIPVPLVVHRGARTLHLSIIPTTTSQSNGALKSAQVVGLIITALFLIGCALLISLRRAALAEGRLLALMILFISFPTTGIVVPNAWATAALTMIGYLGFIASLVFLVWLSAKFGARSRARSWIETVTYLILALNAVEWFVFIYGLVTLKFDPLLVGEDNFSNGVSSTAILLTAALCLAAIVASMAVASSDASERPRTGWLLLPLPIAMLGSWIFGGVLTNFAHTWLLYVATLELSTLCSIIGAIAITYALLKRRVLAFEFVIGRTVVVATVSLIVVAAFTLLEWLLGTVLAGVDRTAGLIANAALALVLGLSLRLIHRRVDALVDAVLFRKRHEDERALLAFSKEAAYVTDADALLDRTIANVQRHTDARNAAVYLDGAGGYRPARSFGDTAAPDVDENDGAILALKTWRRPLDPHQCTTSLEGALALPMLGRGRLIGVLLVGERAGGEAFAADEIEALSQFAHGVGSALDALSTDGSAAGLGASLAKIETMIERLPDALADRLKTNGAQP